jgi:hypothetical protein
MFLKKYGIFTIILKKKPPDSHGVTVSRNRQKLKQNNRALHERYKEKEFL